MLLSTGRLREKGAGLYPTLKKRTPKLWPQIRIRVSDILQKASGEEDRSLRVSNIGALIIRIG